MGIRLSRRSSRAFAVFVGSLLFACAPAPRIFLQYGTEFKQTEIEKVVAENPLAPNENIKMTTLGQGQGVSHHVVQVRDREKPHIHKLHDGTVVMVKGRGYLMLENRRIDLSAGDIVFIPRGAVHYFVNTAGEPAVAFVVFSPPFDGKDTVPVPKP
ncbi:MAG TPA: cupin domain-containing protein [Candidatus Binatia bacterium]|nr:cupin domain-containing protein [Candidatus Binatia bacterium]